MSTLPIALTQYRASERVWLPVRDAEDLEHLRRLGIETRELVALDDAKCASLLVTLTDDEEIKVARHAQSLTDDIVTRSTVWGVMEGMKKIMALRISVAGEGS